MRSLVLFGMQAGLPGALPARPVLKIDGMPVCGRIVQTKPPAFDPGDLCTARTVRLADDALVRVMQQVIARNLTIIGNCIGLREDLEQAARDFAAGALDVVVDPVFTGDRALPFLDRTFNAPDRFGKVIFQYT